MLYVGWIAGMLGSMLFHSQILLIASFVMLLGFAVWRFSPTRSAICAARNARIENHSKSAAS